MWLSKGLCILMHLLLLAPNNVYPQEDIVIYLTGETEIIGCPKDQLSPTTTKKTLVTTPNPTAGCPESEGFYMASNSSQCFRFYKGTYHSWKETKAFCASEGMALAKPEDHILGELSYYLDQAQCPSGGGPCLVRSVWLGARGTRSKVFVWDRDNSEISNSSPLWKQSYNYDEQPGGNTYSYYCLALKTGVDYSAGYKAGKPTGYSNAYISVPCYTKWPVFCEVIDA